MSDDLIFDASRVTDEQLEAEKNIQDIVEEYCEKHLSKKDADDKIKSIIEECIKNKVFSASEIRNYNNRRDKRSLSGPRSHIDFAIDLRRFHQKEKKTFNYLVEWLQRVKGKTVNYELIGSDDSGYVMLANFDKRCDSPNKPDYKIQWNEKFHYLEIKNFEKEIWFKLNNVKKYAKWKAMICMCFRGSYFIFKETTCDYLLESLSNINIPISYRRGKECIIITKDGVGAHFSLNDLIKKGYVKEMVG